MGKIMKMAVVLGVCLVTFLCAGCGDNYAGKWLNCGGGLGEGIRAKEISIEKNGSGKGYLVNISTQKYEATSLIENEKEYNQSIGLFSNGKDVTPIYQYKFIWDTQKWPPLTATVKDEALVIDGSMDSRTLRYVEKDGTLLFEGVVYKKEGKEDISKFKKQEQERIETGLRKAEKEGVMGIMKNVKYKISKIEFVDGKTK
jgi:hypothetical protein